MKFTPRFFLLLCSLFVSAKARFPFPSNGFAADPTAGLAQTQVASPTNAVPTPTLAQSSRAATSMWVQEAAEHGDPVAQTMWGDSFAKARGLNKSYFEAVKWYRLAAGQGFAPAQYTLGQCLLNGDGGKQDSAEACSWFRQAAAQNEINSTYMIGRYHEEAWGGVTKDDAEAARWYLRCAEYGYPLSLFRIGKLYAEGRGVPQDSVEALKWFRLFDARRSSLSNQVEVLTSFDTARAALLGGMKQGQIDEAKRRAGLFIPKAGPATNYQVTYWKTNTPSPPSADSARPLPAPRIRPAPTVPVTQATADMVIEVPLQIENNRPYVSAKLNGSKTVRLLFDSGSTISFIREKIASKLKLKPTAKVRVNGVDVDVLQGVTLALGGASFSPPRLAIHSLESLRALDPFGEGIVGADLLQNFVVELDYRHGRLRLRDPLRYKYTGPGDYLLMRFDFGRPFLDAKIFDGLGHATTARFLIDTGATGALYLERDFWQTNGIKESIGRALVGKVIGLEGTKRMSMGELNGLQIGHYYIPRPATVFEEGADGPKDVAGLIGGDILRRFTVVFHYGRQQIILIPNGLPIQPTVMTDSASQLNK